DGTWTANGRVVCSAATDQLSPVSTSDGAGGAIIAWDDFRSSATYDVYAQHLLAAGVPDPGWPLDGPPLRLAAAGQINPGIVSDGGGGAIVAWQDLRLTASNIYAQHVQSSGAVDPAWPVDGRAVSTATNTQSFLDLATDGSGGAIIGWQDLRS